MEANGLKQFQCSFKGLYMILAQEQGSNLAKRLSLTFFARSFSKQWVVLLHTWPFQRDYIIREVKLVQNKNEEN